MTEETKNNTNEDAVDQASQEASPPENTAKPAGSDLNNLKQELAAKELEAKSNYDRFLRQVAELDNFKKRTARERDDAIRFANEAMIKDLLPVVDNLERAVAHAAGGGNGKPIVEGVEMVLKGLLDVLAKHGVTQISALGQSFDPSKHEAMAQVESESHEPNAVVDELHKGYMLRDRLLRPALVSVAKAPETREKKNGDSKVENDPSDD
ncbi:MAG TPA: nucleotide exchange factor GrpE [Candidatus Binatia bacterium]|jgi:molecular chaperone GrpE